MSGIQQALDQMATLDRALWLIKDAAVKVFTPARRYEATSARSVIDNAFGYFGLSRVLLTGSHWYKAMEKGFESSMSGNVDYAFVVEADTLLTPLHIAKLFLALRDNDEIDAVCGIQPHTTSLNPLIDGGLTTVEGDADLKRVNACGFGLVALRPHLLVDVQKPWFEPVPTAYGDWSEGAYDPDQQFWRKWAAADNTLFQCQSANIAHLAEYAVWYDTADFSLKAKPVPHWRHEFLHDGVNNGV